MACLDADPEMASLNMGTLMRQTGANAGEPFANLTKDIEAWAAKMKEMEIKPEMECYSQSMYRDVNNLIKKGLIDPPYYVNFVLGMMHQGAIEATPDTLYSMYQFLPPDCYFNTTATGAAQLPVTTMGMLLGGAARVGLEDNIYFRRGELVEEQRPARGAHGAHRPGAQPAAGHPGRGQGDPRRRQEMTHTKGN